MDPQKVKAWEAQCIQEQPPFCNAACPVHVDVRGMVERVRKADFKGALGVYARSIPFPSLLSRICDHPCERSCKRRDAGDALHIHALERACVDYGGPAPVRSKVPSNGRKVAVVGGGLSGLTAAVELAAKGCGVTVFEKEPELLPRIPAAFRAIADCDLRILSRLEIEVHTDSTIDNVPQLAAGFDAVYVTVASLAPAAIDPETLATDVENVFAGGSLRFPGRPWSPIQSVQDGRCAAVSIDRHLQGASLTAAREPAGPGTTRLYVNTSAEAPALAVEPADPAKGYTREEAVREAGRCFPCGCLECVKACEYLAQYRSYPKRYVREIYNNETIVMGCRPANRMINSCSLCGLCREVCPEKLNMADVCLSARETMVERGKMPASAHEFALRDMDFSISDAFTLARPAPRYRSSAAVFFPGCQLSASSPEQVFRTYDLLRRTVDGGVGLILGCCGAPARWAGNRKQAGAVLDSFRSAWSSLGQPRVITACSSCYRTFTDDLPDVPLESLWNVLAPADAPVPAASRRLALHDPCSTRHDAAVQNGARRLLSQLGVEVQELNRAGETTCCGYGGLARFVNPEVTRKTLARRIAQSDCDYVTYCAMCRDSFAQQGKRALHVLDLLFPDCPDPAARPDPGFSRRRENRARLKQRFLREFWSEPMPEELPRMRLKISPEIALLLEQRMILEEDVRAVIAHAEQSGDRFEKPEAGTFLASFRPACVTFWVEYSSDGDGFVVHNAYSHRMEIA